MAVWFGLVSCSPCSGLVRFVSSSLSFLWLILEIDAEVGIGVVPGRNTAGIAALIATCVTPIAAHRRSYRSVR